MCGVERTGMDSFLISGRYRTLHTLGEGSQGRTFLAEDQNEANRLVTVKVIPVEGPEDQKHFDHECGILKSLNHPHLGRLLSFGQQGDFVFYVSEYVEGKDIVTEARDRDWNAVFSLIVQAAWGLDHLHRHHLIHRDIKPENILVGRLHEGTLDPLQHRLHLKIIDFSLAIEEGNEQANHETVGTLSTMAPEVVQGRSYDHRADLYSFGIVLYEMALGKIPFIQTKGFGDYLNQIRAGKVDLKPLLTGDTPRGVVEVIGRLVEKDPQRRFASAQEIILLLNEVEKESYPLTAGSLPQNRLRGSPPVPSLVPPKKFTTAPEILKELLALSRSGKKAEAWDFAGYYFEAVKDWTDPPLVEDFFATASHLLIEKGQYTDAKDLLEKMGSHPALKGRPVLERSLMEAYLSYRSGDLKRAEGYLNDIPPQVLSAAPPDKKARAANYRGLLCQAKREFSEAAAHFERGAGFAQQSGRRDQQANLILNAGTLYYQRGDWAKAFELFQTASQVSREIQNDLLIATALNNLGNLFLNFGRFREAAEAIEESLQAARRQDLKPLVAYNLYLMTVIEEGQGNVERVDHALKEALSYARTLGDTLPMLQSLVGKASWELTQKNLKACEETIGDLKRRAEKSSQDDYVLQADWLLAKLRIAAGEVQDSKTEDTMKRVKEDAQGRGSKTVLWQALSDEGDMSRLAGDLAGAQEKYRDSLNVIDALKKEVPPQFQESFLRDRKKEKVRTALESVGEHPSRNHPDSVILSLSEESPVYTGDSSPSTESTTGLRMTNNFVFEKSPNIQKEVPMSLDPPPSSPSETKPPPLSFQKWTSLNRRLLTQQKIDDLLEEILDAAVELSDAERGFVIYSETGELSVRAARNMEKESLKKEEERFSATIAQEVLRKGESQVILDAQTDARFAEARSVVALQIRSVLCVPLRVGLRTVGLIYLDNRFRPGIFQSSHRPLLEALADQASLTLEHTRLHRENLERIEELKKSKALIEKLNENLERSLSETTANLTAMRENLKRQNEEISLRYRYDRIIGESKALKSVLKNLDRIVPTDMNVYIFGESGAGKELIAQAIHFNSPRKGGPFIGENCSALSESLLESELFGHVKGAFTGADRNKVGLFEMAHGGTLFLDEVGDMSPNLQAKLLRVLQEGEVRPVGGKDYRKVDVRVVSASHRDLAEMIKQGGFRRDLYYRLNVVRLDLPPLRDRREDIPLLVDHFLAQESAKSESGRRFKISKAALKVLMNYDWPGNIRELQNEIQRLVALSEGSEIKPDLISSHILEGPGASSRKTLEGSVAEVEKKAIMQTMARVGGNKVKAAALLKVSRRTLYSKLTAYGIDPRLGKIS